jgi:hypothetical protein
MRLTTMARMESLSTGREQEDPVAMKQRRRNEELKGRVQRLQSHFLRVYRLGTHAFSQEIHLHRLRAGTVAREMT